MSEETYQVIVFFSVFLGTHLFAIGGVLFVNKVIDLLTLPKQ